MKNSIIIPNLLENYQKEVKTSKKQQESTKKSKNHSKKRKGIAEEIEWNHYLWRKKRKKTYYKGKKKVKLPIDGSFYKHCIACFGTGKSRSGSAERNPIDGGRNEKDCWACRGRGWFLICHEEYKKYHPGTPEYEKEKKRSKRAHRKWVKGGKKQ